jgi:dTDP-glucose pyrophosphorylase
VSRLVAVVPAAGFGTRLAEALAGAGAGSKETMPVRGRPVIDYLLDHLRRTEPAEIRVVTRAAKTDLVEHLTAVGVQVVLGEPADVAASLTLGIAGLEDDDLVVSGFPDTLWSPANGLTRLVGALTADPLRQVALGLFQVPDVRSADEVVVEADEMGLTVVSVRPKPTEPVSDITWGCLAARVSALRALTGVSEPGTLWDRMAHEVPGSVVGLHLGREFVDVGTPEGLARVR